MEAAALMLCGGERPGLEVAWLRLPTQRVGKGVCLSGQVGHREGQAARRDNNRKRLRQLLLGSLALEVQGLLQGWGVIPKDNCRLRRFGPEFHRKDQHKHFEESLRHAIAHLDAKVVEISLLPGADEVARRRPFLNSTPPPPQGEASISIRRLLGGGSEGRTARTSRL